MSGNDHARFDGTELASIFATRDKRLKRFPRVAKSTIALPPYAALDLKDSLRSGSTTTLWPTSNAHVANDDAIRLSSVVSRSHLGATLTRKGNGVVYTAPKVSSDRTVDWFRYRIVDVTGKTATGVVMMRVSPGS